MNASHLLGLATQAVAIAGLTAFGLFLLVGCFQAQFHRLFSWLARVTDPRWDPADKLTKRR
jgi:hypothetical protein